MVIGDSQIMASPQQMAQPASIDNIMSGISNTGTVKMNNHRKKLRQRFDIIKKLGQGTYGKVQLGINKETSQEVAIKTIKKCKIETDADLIRIRREVQIMSSVQHPNIIHIYEVFENREKMVLVMEFAAGGELYDYLSERKVLAEDEARRVFRQISTAVYYCHKHKICHRDLKLENILLDEHGNAKIADFGLSNVFDDQRLLATFCGSPLYASPEIVKGTPYQGPEVDCWSLGVLLYTLVYGAMPFDGSNFKRLVKQISAGDYYEPKNPSPASSLIKEMLTVCPQRRATIEQICNHWWVNTGYTESCLDLAEELANQTPVRLDVLLSLTPSAVTSDQLVVPGPIEETKPSDRVARSHSVGSIREMGSTEAERRILDMVAAGGEAALAPSPTRTITSTEASPAHPKRKLETTVSTENAVEKKREKPLNQLKMNHSKMSINEEGDITRTKTDETSPNSVLPEALFTSDVNENLTEFEHSPEQLKDLNEVEQMCDQLFNESPKEPTIEKKKVIKKKMVKAATCQDKPSEEVTTKTPTKTTKKVVNKTKTTDIVAEAEPMVSVECKKNVHDEINKPITERRRSKIFETTEKFPNTTQGPNDKFKKIVIPGVSVSSFKKEFERKASLTSINSPSSSERKLSLENEGSDSSSGQPISIEKRKSSICNNDNVVTSTEEKISKVENATTAIDESAVSNDSKSSLTSFSLEEARRSMENSIALLNQAKTESNNELDQLCAITKNVVILDDHKERQEKLKSAREIIGNAIPVGRICMGVRKPPVPFGLNGRSISGSVVPSPTAAQKPERRSIRLQMGSDPTDIRTAIVSVSTPEQKTFDQESFTSLSSNRIQFVNSTSFVVDWISSNRQDIPMTLDSRKIYHSYPCLETLCVLKFREENEMMDHTTLGNHQYAKTKTGMHAAVLYYAQQKHIQTSLTEATTSSVISNGDSCTVGVGSLSDTLENNVTKTSRAEIVLKSATLPRRRTTKAEIQLEMEPKVSSQPMRFQTEIQHMVPDLRSPPIHENSIPHSPQSLKNKATSLEPQQEVIIPIQRQGLINKPSTGNAFRLGSLSRQSTNDSDTDITILQSPSVAMCNNSAQPIKKSPREFIIPIAVEGGGFVTPRAGSLEPPESNHTTFSHMRRPRKISSLINEHDSDEESPFHKLHRHTSIGRENNNDDPPRFAMHRLRTTRPLQKLTQGPTDSGSSGEDDDEDGFEILTAENLFSTLLSRVRALTNRLNVNNEPATGFPSSRFMTNLRETHTPFWNNDPFGSRLNNGSGAWRHSMSRNLTSDIDSMFSRTGATLPRGIQPNKPKTNTSSKNNPNVKEKNPATLDLADLDLSRLRLTKNDLETLSSITPNLPKHFQDQLLAQLPPTQARKLSRTLSMQNNSQSVPVKIYKRSLSGGREEIDVKNEIKHSSTKLSDLLTSFATASTYGDTTLTDDTFIRNSLFRRNCSGSKDSRSSSHCVNATDEYTNYSPRSSTQLSEISEKYKTYNSNSSENDLYLLNRKRCDRDGPIYSSKYYDTLPPRRVITSPSKDYHTRPPSGCLSPPLSQQQCESAFRRRQSQRRLSRFLRPDFFDVPQEESCYVKDCKERDLDTQNYLKQIRERSCKPSLDRREQSAEPFCDRKYNSNIDPITMKDRRKSSIPNIRATSADPSAVMHQVQTRNENKCYESAGDNLYLQRRRSLSKTIEGYDLQTKNQQNDNLKTQSNRSFADRILSELQNISIKQIMIGKDESLAMTTKHKTQEVAIKPTDIKEVNTISQKSIDTERSRKISKLVRPKSYSSKEQDIGKKLSPEKINNVVENIVISTNDKSIRPKSYPTASLAKDVKSTKNVEILPVREAVVKKLTKSKSGAAMIDQTVKKKNKQNKDETSTKTSEKKQKSGFLYSIGQKFEKLRENSKSKVLRKSNNKLAATYNHDDETDILECSKINEAIAESSSDVDLNLGAAVSEEKSLEQKSRIDAMIRNLRERSVTKALTELTESELIQRAVSVEDLSGTLNKCSVNKVFGMFKKFESNSAVQNTKSSSIIDSLVRNESERPKSSEYMCQTKNGRKYFGAKSDTIVTFTDLPSANLDNINGNSSKIPIKLLNCQDCIEEVDATIVTKRHSRNGLKQTVEDKERMKNNRKGLVLDLNKFENNDVKQILPNSKINNDNHSNSKNNNAQTNPLHVAEILSPSYDNLTNYSSDSRSIHDDCASTSTFLSPTDEPELYIDDWSLCSEDNNYTGGTGETPSPPLSRLSRNSQSSLMGDVNNSSESVIDRIKRRSFYCRFNENKPKRQSNIVGPAAREYYREAAAKLKSRPPDRVSSPPTMESHEYYRQLKQRQSHESKPATSSNSNKIKHEDVRAHHRYSDHLLPKLNPLPSSPSVRRISTADNDYKYSHDYFSNTRSSVYGPNSHFYGTSIYSTSGATCLDSYATLGRKARLYNHRSKSLMDSTMCASANSSTLKRDHLGAMDYATLNRPSIRYRTSSTSRSPTKL